MSATGGMVVWVGRGLCILASLLFIMSAVMKFMGGEAVVQGMGHLGLPDNLILPLGILEISCVVIYLIPATAVLGAILLTGFLGGAILAHLRVGDPWLVQAVLGIVLWLGLWLQESRLKSLLPLRRS